MGVEIGSLWNGTPAESFAEWIRPLGSDDEIRVVDSDGEPVAEDAQIATGMLVQVVDPDGTVIQQSEIVVTGDVVGVGEMCLTQLVRMAKAYTGGEPLRGVYKLAGDLDGDDETNLTDLVMMADLYLQSSLNVDFAMTDGNAPEVLADAGYDLSPWTEQMAVLSADIPKGAKVSSIAWIQHDFFPDGKEQELYYEGSEEELIFGAYAEGRTVVTAIVSTESGKQGVRDTEITWTSDSGQEIPEARMRTVPSDEEEDLHYQNTDDSRAVSSRKPGVATTWRPRPTQTAKPSTTPRPSPTQTSKPSAVSRPTATRTPKPSVTPRPTATGTSKPSAVSRPTATRTPKPSVTPRPTVTHTPKPTTTVAATASSSNMPAPVDLLNTFRAEVLTGTNDLRGENRIQPLFIQSKRLSEAAMVRATEMAAAEELSHTRPDGTKYDTVATLGKGTVIGENIHSNSGYPMPQVALTAVGCWENSAPHRKQILEPRYAYTGTGFAQAKNGTWYCVQMFSNGDKVLSIDTPKQAG